MMDSPDSGGGIDFGASNSTNPNIVTTNELTDLLQFFSKTMYKAKDPHPVVQLVMNRCLSLFNLDYRYSIISNSLGELSCNYPSCLVFLESEKKVGEVSFDKSSTTKNNGTSNGDTFSGRVGYNPTWGITSFGVNHTPVNGIDALTMKDLCSRARFARCRARFPVSVILYNNKHICRSATLSGGPELYGRSSLDYLFYGGADNQYDTKPLPDEDSEGHSDWQLFDRCRSQDIRLLKAFRVRNIVDLMVEKKKVKFGMYVTSSEKVDKVNRYAQFNLISLPYPGCEFFKQYRDNNYCAERLIFDWNQNHNDANISVPSDSSAASVDVNWSLYRNWDLVLLTQNYLRLLLAYLRDGDSDNGLLVHCISGWDRTPLFISLLRLSLWADGAIHKTLNAEQIMYLTLAYDWVLFGHNLEDRLNKGEEILYFCFYFLKYIVEPEFSIDAKPSPPSRNGSDTHLADGVLLDGETHTSPEGSNWSINSCGSCESGKSQENPPTYFQVPQDSSWEDCRGAQHLANHNNHVGIHNHPMPALGLSGCGEVNSSCLITNSLINSTSQPISTSPSQLNGREFTILQGESPNTQVCNNIALAVNTIVDKDSSPSTNGIHKKGTSPVAVPNRHLFHHHAAHSDRPRTESGSSASIGSWQMVAGAGSMKEMMSSSDPSSTSSHSHPSRFTMSDPDGIEGSSCTLVEELTPVESKSTFRFLNTTKFEEAEPNANITTSTRVEESKWEVELGLALDEGIIASRPEMILPGVHQYASSPPTALQIPLYDASLASTPTEGPTPTRECDFEDFKFRPDSDDPTPTERRVKLETVRTRFLEVYDNLISSQSRHSTDNGNGGGLGSLIGNFATKVGIRSAPNRSTQIGKFSTKQEHADGISNTSTVGFLSGS